ncbi:MAG: hypothetical protein LBQ08_04190 [Holosporaceae bacterium]|nr:hypothetical protein [Holosporaceae bacterium]
MEIGMHCPRCGSLSKTKSGIVTGSQRYKCKDSGCHYTKSLKRGYPDSIKLKIINLYFEGCGFVA